MSITNQQILAITVLIVPLACDVEDDEAKSFADDSEFLEAEEDAEDVADPVTADGPDSLIQDDPPWVSIAPGVQQRTRRDGSVEQRGSGPAALHWLANQLREEQEELTQSLRDAPVTADDIRERLSIIEERLGQVNARIEKQDLTSIDHSESSIGDACYHYGNYCSVYAEALLDSPGIVDGYSQAWCPGYQVTSSVYTWSNLGASGVQYMSQIGYASRYGYGYCVPGSSVLVDSYADVPCGAFARAFKYYCDNTY